MRNERGITLVALVVTIVVLLILAGVTITYALSDNGLFTRAEDTTKVSEQATVRDAVSNAQAEALIEYYDPNTETASAPDVLIKKYVPADWTVTAGTATVGEKGVIAGTVTVKGTKYSHSVTIANGVVTTITSTEN